jgi:hypothetical protein
VVTGAERTALPDLEDHATIGCLVALVREAWKTSHSIAFVETAIDARTERRVWWVNVGVGYMSDARLFSSEAGALVNALECAPGRQVAAGVQGG